MYIISAAAFGATLFIILLALAVSRNPKTETELDEHEESISDTHWD